MKSVSLKPGLSLLLLTVLLVTNFYSSAQEDLIPFNKYVNGDSKWGYYNTAGQIIVAPKYFEARKFDNGLGKVSLLNEKVEWRYGFVDATGKEIIPLNYSHIDDFSEGLVAAEQYGKTGFLNREGKTVIPFVFENAHDQGFKEGLVAVKQNGKWGFIDKNGRTIIGFNYTEAKYFSNGLAPVNIAGKWGYIDKSGKTVIQFVYSDALTFNNKLSGVEYNNKWAVINMQGKLLTQFKYDDIGTNYQNSDLDIITVSVFEKTIPRHFLGVVDDNGKEILDLKYKLIELFSNDLITLRDFEDKFSMVNRKGKTILPAKYQGIYRLNNGPLGFIFENSIKKTLSHKR